MLRRRPSRRVAIALAVAAAAALAGAAWAATFTNAAAITINDNGAASPYPSNITASGLTGNSNKITATITNLTHTFVADIDILLAGPTGQTVILMSDVGGLNSVTSQSITFDDSAVSSLSCTTAPATGTFKPTNCVETTSTCNPPPPDSFPAPAPAGPYGSTLSALYSQPANGTYSLYVVDDCAADVGTIANGWSITILTPTAVALKSFVATPSRHSVALRWQTASGANLAGFNVYRGTGKASVRLNAALIPAKSSVGAATYRLVDRSVAPGHQYTYRLQAVQLNGARSWVGTAAVRTAIS
jgi:subtilisin-like proprotein convertase family protein